MHAEKVCAAACDTEDSYFIRDDNTAYFDKCNYPSGVIKLDANALKGREKYTKQIGDTYFYVTAGSNIQSPCGDENDAAYVNSLRQYITANMSAL